MLPENTPKFPKILYILLLIIFFFAGSLSCFFFLKFRTNTFFSTSNIPQVTPSPTVIAQSTNLPIDPHSSAVRSAGILYLLAGVVDSVKVIGQGEQASYEMQILSPTGILLDKKFTAAKQSATVVSLDQKGIEAKFTLSQLKKGDQVLINYYINLQENDEGQVSKIAVTKNQ